MPPNDAINQMHRYRDALIHVHQADDGQPEKSRPVLGAFVLYPGCFDEMTHHNPYAEAIETVGIGSFPLLPGNSNSWLKQFLEARFPHPREIHYVIPESDQYLAEDSARIATMGAYLERYRDLTLATSLGNDRSNEYVEKFRNGTASWYHIPLTTTDKKSVERNVMREVRYLAVGVYHRDSKERFISHLYEVKSVQLVKRHKISAEQAGKASSSSDEYWLFELGFARPMTTQIKMNIRSRKFPFQLTNAKDLLKAAHWEDLPSRYALLT